ncbi:hypothetical protein [Methyloversatilis discipulorum]|uniref:hypothetical protein n=1 Tax=Methyloversatilis discipulorum TaxID=1119528 RepID=UPI001A39A1D5|nr:hypothetical protein [Methyloversatilis discipulorum]MBL8466897.1 hypothetical protein [Methyloversatilis discipulorum]
MTEEQFRRDDPLQGERSTSGPPGLQREEGVLQILAEGEEGVARAKQISHSNHIFETFINADLCRLYAGRFP